MRPADFLALVVFALLAAFCAYHTISWLADRIISTVAHLTRHETREGIGVA